MTKRISFKGWFTPHNCIGAVIALLGAFFLFPFFFDMVMFPLPKTDYLYGSLDPSWALSMNYANIKGRIWGEDFAFTFGPLSYLALRIGWGVEKWQLLLFDLFYFVNLFVVFFVSYRKSENKLLAAIAIVMVSFLIPGYLGGAYSLTLFMMLVFHVRMNLEQPKWFYQLFAMILLVLLVFIKFNTALIAFVPYYGMLVYFALKKTQKWPVLLFNAILPILLILWLASVLRVELAGYVVSGMEFVSGYNEVMYFEGTYASGYRFCFAFMGISAALLLIKMYRDRKDWLKSAFIFGVFSITIFVLYKQAFVRADISHMLDFFRYCIFILICLSVDVFWFKIKDWKMVLGLMVLVIPFYTYCKNTEGDRFNVAAKLDKMNYINGMGYFTPESSIRLFPNDNQLPESVKSKIGNNSVDAYPWDSHMLFDNKLNYKPRPVIQSYAAYTPYLEELNFKYYNSDQAPQFVIYDYASTDMRYALFDESKLHLVLLKKYEIAEEFEMNGRHLLLLRKKAGIGPVVLTQEKQYALLMGSALQPEPGYYYEVEIYQTFSAKIGAALTHAPEIELGIRTKNNKIDHYRTSPGLLKTGLFSNYHITSTQSFAGMMKNDSIPDEFLVEEYKITPKNTDKFKDKLKITAYKIQ